MKNLILAPVVGLLLLIPGDTIGFPRGGGGVAVRPAPRPEPARTPSFNAPAARPNYEPAARHDYAPAARPTVQPAFVPKPANVQAGGIGNRSNINGGNTINAGNRPNISTANNTNITTGNRPNVGIGNRPDINTGAINTGNRPIVGSGNNNTLNVNRQVNVNNQNQVNRHINATYPNGGMYRPGYAYYHGYYNSWHHGYWNSWNYNPWLWGGVGLATGLVLGAGGAGTPVVYSDPYYDVPVAAVDPVFDYSQPIPVPQQVPIVEAPPEGAPVAAQPPTAPADANSAAAQKLLDAARDAFMKKDYDTAQKVIDKAIAQLPGDTTLHEFRALVLFARQQYREAAAVIHAVLAVGPGWDWDTLKTLYPDTQTYTEQLRALESYCKANPMAASARFLLAYHYLILDARDAAVKMLKSVVALLPSDDLAVYLIKALDPQSEPNRPTPGM